jgi:mannose-6-phosphate isomerase-like protein (cupin superfamily)
MEVLHHRTRPEVQAADGSSVRELAHPATSGARAQSVAEATVPAGSSTHLHLHRRSEEIYLFTAGSGRMQLGEEEAPVVAGDLVVIPPDTPHRLHADAEGPLVLLCCCSPPYAEEDTELLAAAPDA